MSPASHPRPGAGLCETCLHQRLVRTTRGSEFSLCGRSRDEPERYSRYPRLPVLACPGFEQRPAGSEAPPATGSP